jgi:MFS family permease
LTNIPRPVRLLGWTSLFTDAATEMIYPLLPVFLSRVLGAGALSLGIIEGAAEAVNSVLKVASGYMADRLPWRRPIVIAGYTLSSLARPLIALTTMWPQVLVIRLLDRTGKGIRGAPRDAMLAQFAAPGTRGRIFGFHRAMDHAGAIVGPIVATIVLFFAPGEYRLLFALTIIPGAIAVAMLFLVPEPESVGRVPRASEGVGRVPRAPGSSASGPAGRLPPSLWAFLAVLLIFSVGNSADAFLLLRLSDALGGATYIPLLWAGIHVVKASLSTWGGALSDRLGRRRVIAIGWAIYAVAYLGFAASSSASALVGWFLVYGVHYALAESAEKALVADLVPASQHGSAFGLYNAALGVGALAASVVFGLLYERLGPAAAFGFAAAPAGAAALLLPWVPMRDAKIVVSNGKNSRDQ